MRRHLRHETVLGTMLIVADGDAIVGAYFVGQKYLPPDDRLGAEAGTDPLLETAAAQLDEYFAGDRVRFDLPLAPVGEPFQQQVWDRLLAIPYGETTTYGSIAADIGRPQGAQAVGGAVGHNPISIMIPCHRVLGADGSLTGFAGGLDRKRALLDLEEPEERRASRLF